MTNAATQDEARLATDVNVEDAGPARKKLTITIAADAIDERLQDSMDTLAVETVLPGFRKGRAPKSLIHRRFGDAVRNETKNQIVADAYSQALEENEIKPVGEPEIVTKLEDLELESGKPLTFEIEVEIVPVFELPAFDGITVKKPTFDVDDEHIENEISRLALRFGTAEEVESDYAQGDRLGGSAVAYKEDEEEPFFRTGEAVIVHPGDENDGAGNVLGLLVDGLDKLFNGKTVGDTVTIETVGPEQYEREDLRGKKIRIEFTIEQTQRPMPASTEDLVALYGLPSEEILREQVRLALEQRRDREVADITRKQACSQLAEKASFELPEKLTEAQAARTLERRRMELLYRGMSVEDVEQNLAELRSGSEQNAQDQLKSFFVMHRLAEHFEIDVSEQEVNGYVAALASENRMRPQRMRRELEQSGRLDTLRQEIREKKAADRLLNEVTIEDITLDEWNELQGNAPAKPAASKKKTTKKKTTKKTSKKTTSKKKSAAAKS